jgi:hypothetical protein
MIISNEQEQAMSKTLEEKISELENSAAYWLSRAEELEATYPGVRPSWVSCDIAMYVTYYNNDLADLRELNKALIEG